MNSKRILRHILFWSVFFCMSLYNVLYMSSSFSMNPNWDSFLRLASSQALIYAVKVIVVYYSIYSIIPRWIKNQKSYNASSLSHQLGSDPKTSLKYFLEFIIVVLVGTLLIRVLTHTVIWGYIFSEESRSFSFSTLLARYIYSLFDIIPIALGAVAIKLVQLRVKTLKHESTLVQEKLNTELLYLKSQTNPHFLFNTLNGIYALSRKQDPNTPKAIMQLSKILRYMLYESSVQKNPIREELQLITDYIALQKLRFQEHLIVKYTSEVDDDNIGISPLLLLPLIENAFKHSNDLNTDIEINISVKESVLNLSIKNNLSDNTEKEGFPKDGIGLPNIKRQLALLYSNYNFKVMKNESDFEVTLKIDLNSFINA